jgi:hypothetical protein
MSHAGTSAPIPKKWLSVVSNEQHDGKILYICHFKVSDFIDRESPEAAEKQYVLSAFDRAMAFATATTDALFYNRSSTANRCPTSDHFGTCPDSSPFFNSAQLVAEHNTVRETFNVSLQLGAAHFVLRSIVRTIAIQNTFFPTIVRSDTFSDIDCPLQSTSQLSAGVHHARR